MFVLTSTCNLFNDVVSSSEYEDPNNKMVDQWRIAKYVEENDGDPI
jgi:hypothetical protein